MMIAPSKKECLKAAAGTFLAALACALMLDGLAWVAVEHALPK